MFLSLRILLCKPSHPSLPPLLSGEAPSRDYLFSHCRSTPHLLSSHTKLLFLFSWPPSSFWLCPFIPKMESLLSTAFCLCLWSLLGSDFIHNKLKLFLYQRLLTAIKLKRTVWPPFPSFELIWNRLCSLVELHSLLPKCQVYRYTSSYLAFLMSYSW